ncbi:MAG: hypothetical protein QGH37_30920 [Candidatus Poribacteria bacterium]|nr:hypothetical protein [Candidatus Poribacteria bacterium]
MWTPIRTSALLYSEGATSDGEQAWANTFDFLPAHWQNQQRSSARRAFNRSMPRASHL